MTPRSPLILAQEYMLSAEEAAEVFEDSATQRECRVIRLAIKKLYEKKFGAKREEA